MPKKQAAKATDSGSFSCETKTRAEARATSSSKKVPKKMEIASPIITSECLLLRACYTAPLEKGKLVLAEYFIVFKKNICNVFLNRDTD